MSDQVDVESFRETEINKWLDIVVYHLRESLPELADITNRLDSRAPSSSVGYAHFLRSIALELSVAMPNFFGSSTLRDESSIKNEAEATMCSHSVIMAIAQGLANYKGL